MPVDTERTERREINIMNDRVNSLESMVVLSTEASKNVSNSVNELLMEFKERDIRHEFEHQASLDLGVKVHTTSELLHKYIDEHAETLKKAKVMHNRWDTFWNSMTTNAGKIVLGILLFGLMVMFGLDPRDLVKG
jgi:hypothetical protein